MIVTVDPLLSRLVREALKDSVNNREKAQRHAVDTLDKDPGLRTRVLGSLIWETIRQQTHYQYDAQRRQAIGGRNELVDVKARLEALGAFPLRDGTAIRRSTAPQLRAASDFWLKQARMMQKRGRWMRAIADAMPDDRTMVGKILSDNRLAELWEEASCS